MTNPKPRIAILHYAAPPTVGGVESTIAAHARLFADHGYVMKIIAGRGEPVDPRVSVEIIRDVGSQSARVLSVNAELARGIVSEEFRALVDELTRKLEYSLTRFDVLIAHNVLSLHKNLALTVALKNLADACRIRIIAWCHDFAWGDPQYASDVHPGLPWELLKQRWTDVTYVVVSASRQEELEKLWETQSAIPSEATSLMADEETLRGVHPEERNALGDKTLPKISIVPPGIDPFEFLGTTKTAARWTHELALLDAAPLLLVPSRITRRKNIERAIEITAALMRQGWHPKLIVTGPPGPHNPTNAAYLEQLRVLRQSLGVEDTVIFLHELGEVHAAVLRDLYLLADALLFPSEREGFGIPLLEAGLARLPIFCSDLPPFRETAHAYAHYLSPDESADTTAARMTTYFKSDSSYQMKRRVVSEYNWEHIFSERIEPLLRGT